MQVVVVKSPKLLRGLLCRLFGIKKSPKRTCNKNLPDGCVLSGRFFAHTVSLQGIKCAKRTGKERVAWN